MKRFQVEPRPLEAATVMDNGHIYSFQHTINTATIDKQVHRT